VMTNGSVNIEGVKDINMYSNAISLQARPRLFTTDGKTIPGKLELFGDNLVHIDGTQIEVNSSISLNNPPSKPIMNFNSLGEINMQSTAHMNIMGTTNTYLNAGNQVEIQTSVIPQPPAMPCQFNLTGIDTVQTTNTLLSFNVLGLTPGYPKRTTQDKLPTPLLLFDQKLNTIITRWVGIEPSPSRSKK